MTIRPVVENDIDQIRALIESIPGLWHPDWRSDVLERAIRSAGELAVVWIENDKIVGFVCAHDVGFLAYLSLLAVAEGTRGRGVGTALIRHIEQTLATRGCAILISDVWQDAAGFYETLGWSTPSVILLRHRLLA
jgi:ribosomal protein S18 acetylase RimI-like enzyme